jgi:hypothetical protein
MWAVLLTGVAASAIAGWLLLCSDEPSPALVLTGCIAPGLIIGGAIGLLQTDWDRYRERHCPACGYDLTGIKGPCPECGHNP